MFEKAYQTIEKYDSIVISGHIKPDGDSYGSTWGLTSYLRMRYPDKRVYCVGDPDGRLKTVFPSLNLVDTDTVRSSLGITCDCSTRDRVADQRIFECRELIKIDHHDGSEPFGEQEYVFPRAASACQVVCEMILEKMPLEEVGVETATYLYAGILTDTLNFTTANCDYRSLELGAMLVKNGIDLSRLDMEINSFDRKKFALISEFRSKITVTDEHVGYGIVDKDLMRKYGVEYNEAKDLIQEFNKIRDCEVWAMFIEETKYDDHRFNASLRSRKAIINKVAEKFGGGGHLQAAGTGFIYRDQFDDVIKELTRALLEQKKDL